MHWAFFLALIFFLSFPLDELVNCDWVRAKYALLKCVTYLYTCNREVQCVEVFFFFFFFSRIIDLNQWIYLASVVVAVIIAACHAAHSSNWCFWTVCSMNVCLFSLLLLLFFFSKKNVFLFSFFYSIFFVLLFFILNFNDLPFPSSFFWNSYRKDLFHSAVSSGVGVVVVGNFFIIFSKKSKNKANTHTEEYKKGMKKHTHTQKNKCIEQREENSVEWKMELKKEREKEE